MSLEPVGDTGGVPHSGGDPRTPKERGAIDTYQIPQEVAPLIETAREVLNTIPAAKSPLVIFDLDKITEQVNLWREKLGGIDPHFAVKCCNHPVILSHLNSLGVSFDAATAGEIAILEKIGVDPKKVICTHPIRDAEDIEAISRYKPRALVVESSAELRKLQAKGIPSGDYSPQIILRLELPFGGLSGKFGAEVTYLREDGEGTKWQIITTPAEIVFKEAQAIERETGAKYGGFGFSSHVGTNTTDIEKYQVELKVFAHLTEKLAARGVEISTFNLGGGYPNKEFPKSKGTTQEEIVSKLGDFLADFMKQHPSINFIAEPGRFMVSNSGSVVIGVMDADKRQYLPQENGTIQRVSNLKIQLNDGLYGNLLGERHDDRSWKFTPFRLNGDPHQAETIAGILNGKTCDSWDKIARLRSLPKDLRAGDLLLVDNAGDYTIVTGTEFNSVSRSQVCTVKKNADGSKEFKLYNVKGEEVTDAAPKLSAETLPAFPKGLIPSLSIMGGLSQVPTLSRVAGSAAGDLDSSFLHPGELLGEAGWERVLTLMAKNDVTLQVRNVLPIAEGGMGWVMKVTEEGLDRPVALKVGKVQATGDLGERFRTEAAKTAALKDDPRIPTIHRFGVMPDGNHPYYVMEFVEGKTLEALLPGIHLAEEKRDWRKGERAKVLEHVQNAAEALQYAHNNGVIHRDIKPANLMVPNNRDLPVKVLDWGLLKAGVEEETLKGDVGAYGQTRMGAVLGTVDYMSPEQARGEEVGEATDVWALGATLYRICTNELPLAHHGDEEARLQALRSGRDPVKDPSGVPDELKAIILKAMALNPKERYETAAEFALDLENYLEQRVVRAHAESLSTVGSWVYSAQTFIERERKAVAGVGALILALGAGAFKYSDWKDEENQREAALQVAATELKNTKERAVGALEEAKKAAEEKDLQGAINKLSEDLILRLQVEVSANPGDEELRKLSDDVQAHKADWVTLKTFKDKIFSVYSSLVDTFEFGAIKKIDVKGLEEAAKIYLPEGLTEEGIANLRKRLDDSKLTHEQRMQVGDGLIEWAVFQAGEEFPEVLIDRDKVEGPKRANEFLARVELIEKLAAGCEGIHDQVGTGWIAATEWMKRGLYRLIDNQQEYAKTFARSGSVSEHRASALFLVGAFSLYSRDKSETPLNGIRQNLEVAITNDQKHIAAKYFLAQVVFKEAETTDSQDKRRKDLRILNQVLESCKELDGTNAYLLGRITILAQQIWDIERLYERTDRENPAISIQGKIYGKLAIEQCQLQGKEIPIQLWAAYGELCMAGDNFPEACRPLEIALAARPEDFRLGLFLNVSRILSGKLDSVDESILRRTRESSYDVQALSPRILPEVLVALSFYGSKLEQSGNLNDSLELKTECLEVVEHAIETVPAYKGLLIRLAPIWTPWIYESTEFKALLE